MTNSTVSVVLRGVQVNVHVGVHPWERHPERPTRLLIDLTLEFSYNDYFEKHGGYVNYDPLRTFVSGLANKPHVDWLETIAQDILKAAFELTPAQRAHLQIIKPDIFNEVDEVGLEFDVDRTDFRG
ncbi:MAG: dihydroneopterin aldolase [Terricaulis sp.]